MRELWGTGPALSPHNLSTVLYQWSSVC